MSGKREQKKVLGNKKTRKMREGLRKGEDEKRGGSAGGGKGLLCFWSNMDSEAEANYYQMFEGRQREHLKYLWPRGRDKN